MSRQVVGWSLLLIAVAWNLSAQGQELGFKPLHIRTEQLTPFVLQGQLIDGDPVSGSGIRIVIDGPHEEMEIGRPYRFSILIEPGDDWDGERVFRHVLRDRGLHGIGASQFIIAAPRDAIEISNLSVRVDGTTDVEAVLETFSFITGGFAQYARDQIARAFEALVERAAEELLPGQLSDDIVLEEPFSASQLDDMDVYWSDFGGWSIVDMNSIKITFDAVRRTKHGNRIVFIPDIRATGEEVGRLPWAGSSFSPITFEYRQEIVLSLGTVAEASTNSEHSYFPLSPGNSWTYETETTTVYPPAMAALGDGRPERGQQRVSVEGRRRVGGKDCVVVSDHEIETCYYLENGRLMIASDTRALEQYLSQYGVQASFPMVYLGESLSPGDSWNRLRVSGGPQTQDMVSRVVGYETVHVPAGTFREAVRIETEVSPGSGVSLRMVEWFVKGVGLVKSTMRMSMAFGEDMIRINSSSDLLRYTRR